MTFEKKKDEGCENAKEVASRFGFQIVCDEEEEVELESADAGCENAKQVASRHGMQVVCDDQEISRFRLGDVKIT